MFVNAMAPLSALDLQKNENMIGRDLSGSQRKSSATCSVAQRLKGTDDSEAKMNDWSWRSCQEVQRRPECHGLGRLGLHLGRAIDRLEAGLQKEPAQASEGEELKCDGLHIETEPPSSIYGFGLLCQSLSAAPPPTSHVISELVLSPVTPCPLILSPRLYLLLSNQRLSRI
jgi:hypothetical protein